MTPQTSVTAVETGLPVAPPALATSPGEPAWTLSRCTVAGRQQRAPLSWAGNANRPESTEKWNSSSPAVATLTAAPSTSLRVLNTAFVSPAFVPGSTASLVCWGQPLGLSQLLSEEGALDSRGRFAQKAWGRPAFTPPGLCWERPSSHVWIFGLLNLMSSIFLPHVTDHPRWLSPARAGLLLAEKKPGFLSWWG